MQIGDKMFAYIDIAGNLTQSMVDQYNNSMIFLGDEKQIFVPKINAYVGLGQSAYSYILDKLNNNETDLSDLLDHINKNNVTSIYAQYSEKDFGEQGNYSIPVFGDTPLEINSNVPDIRDSQIKQLQAKRNVVIRGMHDDNILNANNIQSGINVSIKHEGTLKKGVDGKYQFSYHDPEHDIIMIDDSKTWSYIATVQSYIIDFTSKFATQQANRIYKNIIGQNDTVYVEKEFDEAFINDGNSLKEIEQVYIKKSTNEYLPVYLGKDLLDNGTTTDGNSDNINNTYIYYKEELNSSINYYPIYDLNNKTIILPPGEDINDYLDENGGYETYADGTAQPPKIPVWYQKDETNTASYNENIADGIQTIKEVAYILDKITNGDEDDGAIQLSYNIAYNFVEIQKLKDWQQNIGSSAVKSFEGESHNDYLRMSYYSKDLWETSENAKGSVALELDLILAQTYTLTINSQEVSYAAYLSAHDNLIDKKEYYTIVDDETAYNNYYSLSDFVNPNSKIHKMIIEYYGEDILLSGGTGAPIFKSASKANDGSNTYSFNENSIYSYTTFVNYYNNGNTPPIYIYWPYKRAWDIDNNTITLSSQGLTTVDWVTTYVSHGLEEIRDSINHINVNSDIADALETLNKNTYYIFDDNTEYNEVSGASSAELGLFVTSITEENGIITVTKNKLPLDSIISNTSIIPGFGTSNKGNILRPVTLDFINHNESNHNLIFYGLNKNTGNFDILTTAILGNTTAMAAYEEFFQLLGDISSFTAVGTNANVNDLILNLGKVSYFYKQTKGGIDQYLPLDPQIAYTNTSLDLFVNDSGQVKTANTIYYLASSTGITKYFDTYTEHNIDGSTTTLINAYVTYLSASSENSSGLADAWDVRRTIESMFTWIDLKTNKVIE